MTENKQPSAEEISHRAYGLYLERGGKHGSDVQDWVRAEKELSGESVVGQVRPKTTQATRNSVN